MQDLKIGDAEIIDLLRKKLSEAQSAADSYLRMVSRYKAALDALTNSINVDKLAECGTFDKVFPKDISDSGTMQFVPVPNGVARLIKGTGSLTDRLHALNHDLREITNNANFEDNIVAILSEDGIPRTVADLVDLYHKRFGKLYSLKDFSGKLSTRMKFGTKIKNVAMKHYPIDKRYWWGLTEWFEGEELSSDYAKKIRFMMAGK